MKLISANKMLATGLEKESPSRSGQVDFPVAQLVTFPVFFSDGPARPWKAVH